MQLHDVEWADSIPLEWIENNVNLQTARATDDEPQWNPLPNKHAQPAAWSGTLGTWRMDRDGQCAVLIEVPVLCATPGELDWYYAQRYPETIQYAEWMRQGIMPPPVGMLRHVDGPLVLLNRRRWLAARMAGVQKWWVWYWGPPHEAHCARSRWWFPEMSDFHVGQYKRIVETGGDARRNLGEFTFGRMQAAGIAA